MEIHIIGNPEYEALLDELIDELNEKVAELAVSTAEKIESRNGACAFLLSALGSAMVNCFHNQADILGVPWSDEEAKAFADRILEIINAQNVTLANKANGGLN